MAARKTIELPTGSSARLKGIGLLCLAVALFSCLDATAKYLSSELPIGMIVFGRYLFHVLPLLIILGATGRLHHLRSRRPGMQFVRGILLVSTTAANFFALRYLQLDQTVSIGFSAPFIVALLAGPMLGEKGDLKRFLAVAAGFVGVLFVVRPDFDLHPAVLVALCSALCYALYSILTRILASYDSSTTTIFFSGMVGLLIAIPLGVLQWVWPTPGAWALMVLIGCLGGAGHYLLIRAHHYAPASVVSPFIYTQLIWMTGLGWLVFDNVPAPITLVGAAIMTASGLYLVLRERRLKLPPSEMDQAP